MGIKASNQITLMNVDLAGDMPEELAKLTTRVTKAETDISQNKSEIELRATKSEVATAKSEAISSANSNTDTKLKDYPTTTEMNSAIKVKADSITASVSSTYATKSDLNATNNTVSELAITAKGVDMISEDSNGKLISFIGNRDGSGVWESKYTVGGNVVSGLYFDFSKNRFVFDGDIVVGDQLKSEVESAITSKGYQTASQVESTITGKGYQTSSQVESAITSKGYQTASQVTTITKNTVTTSYVNALNITAGSVKAENITGTTISGKTISGGSININNRFKVDSSGNVTLPDNASISWSQVSSKPTNLATTSDIPSDSYITSITQNNVTTTYLNSLGITAGSVAAENITGTTISGKTISGGSINIGSGTFTVSSAGALTATSANISGVLKAGQGSSIARFSVDENSIYSGSWGSTGPSVFMGTGTSGSYTIGGVSTTGWVFGAGGNFGVTKNGELYCTGGKIGGFAISDTSLISSRSGYGLGLYPAGITYNNYTFYVVIFKNGGATPVGGLTASGWKTIS